MEGSTAYGILNSKIKGLASGFDHATKTGDNTFDIYFKDGSHVSLTIPQPELDEDKIKEQIEGLTDETVADWLEENKDNIKGEDGKGVQILSDTETEADIKAETVLAFELSETIAEQDEVLTMVESDVRYAKRLDVGDIKTLAVSTWEDLVEAINTTWLAGAGGFNFDAERRVLEIQTRGGQIINIDVSQIILATSITDFRDMLVLNIKDGESLVWNETRKKFVNKAIDSSAVYERAVEYTDKKVQQMTDTDAIPCDAEPTFFGGIVTYVRSGVQSQIEVSGKKVFFYYYDEDGNATQKIWIEGTPFTISMGGNLNLEDYIKRDKVIDEFDEEFTVLDGVVSTAYMKAFMQYMEANGAGWGS